MAEPVRVPAFQAPTAPLRPETAPTAVVRTPALGGAAPAPVAAPAPAEVTIVCPECGTASPVALARRDADDFCPTCDYPLFWARPQDRTVPPQDGPDDARRRSPGASGALLLATAPCPVCEELNLPSAVVCVRCGADMVPPPPPVPVPLPVPQPVVVVPVVVPREQPKVRFPWWWYLAMAAIGGIAWWVSAHY